MPRFETNFLISSKFILLIQWDFYNKLPSSDYQRDLQELSVSPIEQFIRYTVSEDDYYQDTDTIVLSSSEMLTKFRSFIQLHNIKYEVNAVSLGVRLKNLNISGITTGVKTKTCNKIEIVRKDVRLHLGIDLVKLSKNQLNNS